jgi:hypothetical protein
MHKHEHLLSENVWKDYEMCYFIKFKDYLTME